METQESMEVTGSLKPPRSDAAQDTRDEIRTSRHRPSNKNFKARITNHKQRSKSPVLEVKDRKLSSGMSHILTSRKWSNLRRKYQSPFNRPLGRYGQTSQSKPPPSRQVVSMTHNSMGKSTFRSKSPGKTTKFGKALVGKSHRRTSSLPGKKRQKSSSLSPSIGERAVVSTSTTEKFTSHSKQLLSKNQGTQLRKSTKKSSWPLLKLKNVTQISTIEKPGQLLIKSQTPAVATTTFRPVSLPKVGNLEQSEVYQKLELRPTFGLNKSRSEVILHEKAQKRVARREYYGYLIYERLKAFLKQKQSRMLSKNTFNDANDKSTLNDEDEGEDEHEHTAYIFDNGQKHLDWTQPAEVFHLPLSKPSLTRTVVAEHRRKTESLPNLQGHSVTAYANQSQEEAIPHEKSQLVTPLGVNKVKKHVSKGQVSNAVERTQSTNPFKDETVSTPPARSELAIRAEGSKMTIPVLRGQSTIPVGRFSMSILASQSKMSIVAMSQASKSPRLRAEEMLNELTPLSSEETTYKNSNPNPLPSAELSFQEIYDYRRTLRLAKIKGQLEAKKRKTMEPDDGHGSLP